MVERSNSKSEYFSKGAPWHYELQLKSIICQNYNSSFVQIGLKLLLKEYHDTQKYKWWKRWFPFFSIKTPNQVKRIKCQSISSRNEKKCYFFAFLSNNRWLRLAPSILSYFNSSVPSFLDLSTSLSSIISSVPSSLSYSLVGIDFFC